MLGEIRLLDFSCGMNLSAQGTHIIDWAMSLNEDSPIVRVFGTVSVPSRWTVPILLRMPHRAKWSLKTGSMDFGTPVLRRHAL